MNVYAHCKVFNIAILENTWPDAAIVRNSLNICHYIKNNSAQSYLWKMLLKLFLSCFLTMARWLLLCVVLRDIFLDKLSTRMSRLWIILKYRTFFFSLNFAMNYICKQVKILRLFKFHGHWLFAKEFIDWWIRQTFTRWADEFNEHTSDIHMTYLKS